MNTEKMTLKMQQNNNFNIGIVLLILLCLQIIPVTASETQELGKVVFEQVVIPFTNITILDDTFNLMTTKNHPEKLILLNGDNRLILEVGELVESEDYNFEILWKRFNDSKTGILDTHGTPIFGAYNSDFGEINSFFLRAYLRKPVLEIGHTINSKFKNSKSTNTFSFEPHETLNITTTIFNHGIHHVQAKIVEMIHKNMDVILPIGSKAILAPSGDETFDKQIIFEEKLEDAISFSYQLIPKKDFTFTFKTKAYYTYHDRDYTVVERNKTIINIDSGIQIESGFNNNKAYVLQWRQIEIGDEYIYALIIHNNQNNKTLQNVEVSLITQDNIEVSLKQDKTKRILKNNAFEKNINIGPKNKSEFLFNVKAIKSGNYTLQPKITYEINGHKEIFNSTINIFVKKRPLEPKILFNSSTENESSEVLMYLINPNKNATIFNLNLTVESRFGNVWDSVSYFYPEIDIDGTFIINKFGMYIYNNTGDYVNIQGSFETAYGEVMFFSNEKNPISGFANNYYRTSADISESNNLDLRYEEVMASFNRKRPLTLSEQMSKLSSKVIQSSSVGTTKNNYIVPVLVFVSIIGIQVLQYVKRKKKQ